MADPRTGTFDVEATFDPQPQGSGVNLASGLVADMVISPKVAATDARKLSIPITAVLEAHGDEGFVFVYDAATNRVARRRITIGPIKSGQIVVTQGVAIGEQVVTKGAIYLRDGDSVTVSANAESKP
jgi:multidrug efflux pump subunit AcrA (membrane-fusion protein)